jgi:DNA-binding NarL/FixJ family response regulator
MQPRANTALIHVALVEDDVRFQNALVAAIHATSDLKLLCIANTRADALRMLEGVPADVLVVDLGLPDGSGIDVIQAALDRWPSCGVMVSTGFGDEAHVVRSIEAGATGYLLKDGRPEKMMEEIRSLNGGGSPISPRIARQILMRFRHARAFVPDFARARTGSEPEESPRPATRVAGGSGVVLSAREREVLELITRGFTVEEIASLMQVSRHTVQTFVRRIYSKLNVSSKAAAIFEARNQGLLGK